MSYKVLVLLKPGEIQPALVRASEFAHFMTDLEVVLVRVVNEFSESNKAELQQRYERELNNMMQPYHNIPNYQNVILFNQDVAGAFCAYAKEHADDFDLAIISANKRNTFKDLFVSTIDSQIMRKIHLPLLVVKDPNAPQRLGRAIVLAIDFEESHHDKAIDEVLFAAAKIFADNFNGEVHLVNCVPPIHRGMMAGNISSSSLMLGTAHPITRSDVHGAHIADFAEKHGVPADHCHIAEGRVDEMIPKVCTKLEARMVCMGASSNDGLLSILDQGVSELVLEQIHGDIFIVNRHLNIEQLAKRHQNLTK